MVDNRFDQARRFLLEEADIRGETVHLESAYTEVLALHQYSAGVARLLGELLAASVLLSSNLKFEGKLVLQARSEGQLPLLMVECDHNQKVRGIARGAEQATATSNAQLLYNGHLSITVEPANGQRYQGIIALQAGSMADNLNAYFKQSEQLGSRIWLAADGNRAAGMLLQQLPLQVAQDENLRQQQWEKALTLACTIRDQELLELDSEALLRRLYHADPVRLFDACAVAFCCSCSRARTQNALSSLHPGELEDLLADMGTITMDCEFCNAQYQFDRHDLRAVLGTNEDKTLH